MPTWICTACGERYDEKKSPCLQCASEQLALLDQTNEHDIGATADLEWICTKCGESHIRNSPPCNQCGNMMLESVSVGASDDTSTDPTDIHPDAKLRTDTKEQSFTADAGDVLFNKSLTRRLIDLELLLITGFTWAFFLLTEVIYHRWRRSRDEAHKSQYSFDGGIGEGIFTKLGKVLFWGQIMLIGLVFLAVLS